jgi:hypothetical protein
MTVMMNLLYPPEQCYAVAAALQVQVTTTTTTTTSTDLGAAGNSQK